MPDLGLSGGRICMCGATLLSRADCLASEDEVLRHVGEAYLADEDYYCIEEDDVLPFAWTCRDKAERQRRMQMGAAAEDISNPFEAF